MEHVDLTGLVLIYKNTRYYVLKHHGVNLILQKEGTSEIRLLNEKKSKFTVDTTNESIDLPLVNATLVRKVDDDDVIYQLNGISGELMVNSEIIGLSSELNSGDNFQIYFSNPSEPAPDFISVVPRSFGALILKLPEDSL